MCNEDLNIIGTVTKVLNSFEVDLTLHSGISLLPILLREGGHIFRISLVETWLTTLLVKGH
jgi:hypothetical protein